MAKSRELRSMWLVALIATTICEEHTVYWTREGVQQYSATSPLQVQIGDSIFFNCTGNPDFYGITRLDDIRQYESCNCTAAGLSCPSTSLVASLCTDDPMLPPVTVDINQPSAGLESVVHYDPGVTYYFTSFPIMFENGFPMSAGVGGACERSADGPGLKMAIRVLDSTTSVTQEITAMSETGMFIEDPSTKGLKNRNHGSINSGWCSLFVSVAALMSMLMSAGA